MLGDRLKIDKGFLEPVDLHCNPEACGELAKTCLLCIHQAHPEFNYTFLEDNTAGYVYFRLDAETYPGTTKAVDKLTVQVPGKDIYISPAIGMEGKIFPDAYTDEERLKVMKTIVKYIWQAYIEKMNLIKKNSI